MTADTIRNQIDLCRKLLLSPGAKTYDNDRIEAFGRLGFIDATLVKDAGLLGEFMEFSDTVFNFRGPGHKIAATHVSTLLNWQVLSIDRALQGNDDLGINPSDPNRKVFSKAGDKALLHALEVFKEQAMRMVQGRPSRSYHTASLRSDAWFRLSFCWQYSEDQAVVDAAVKTATRRGIDSKEREAAIGFLAETGGEEGVPEEVVVALERIVADPPDRGALVDALQSLIELGLADPMTAICATDAWDDKHGR